MTGPSLNGLIVTLAVTVLAYVFYKAGSVAAQWALTSPPRRRTRRLCFQHAATLKRGQIAVVDHDNCDLCA